MMFTEVLKYHSAFEKSSKKLKKTSKKVLTKEGGRGIIVKLLRAREKHPSESGARTLKTIQEEKEKKR
ncbi:MAG: hypothetical protein IJ461_02335, partial [Clostridia bacterium]|nr:hypothetical protein [Clostridia bacterium]